jgi:hypothetical protein
MQPMDERPKLPHYDPDYCQKLAKWTGFVCVAILLTELFMLLFVTPNTNCRGWTMYAEETGRATYLWLLAAVVTGGATTLNWYVVLRWQRFAEAFYDSIAYRDDRPRFPYFGLGKRGKFPPEQTEPKKELDFEYILFFDSNRMFLRMCAAWCLLAGLPLFSRP